MAIEIAPRFRVTGARPRNCISEFRLSLENGFLRLFALRHHLLRGTSGKITLRHSSAWSTLNLGARGCLTRTLFVVNLRADTEMFTAFY
jgi:hypothetical protein